MKLADSNRSTFNLVLFLTATLISCHSRDIIWKTHSTYKSGYCGDLFYFYSDNSFYYSIGCEGRNKFAFGTYSKKGKNVLIEKDSLMDFKLFDSVYLTGMNYDTSVVNIKVKDKFNRPVSNFGFYVLSDYAKIFRYTYDKTNFLDTINNTPVHFTFSENGKTYTIEVLYTDENGVLQIDYNENMVITPLFLVQMKNQFKFENTLPYVNYLYKLNIPKEVFYYTENKYWTNSIPDKIELKNNK